MMNPVAEQSKRALVVVPTYNEVKNIGPLLKQIRKVVSDLHILVVDDSSPDGTADIVRLAQQEDSLVHLLVREKKEGLAAAYLAGFRWGMKKNYDILIEMDADFSHPPKSLSTMLNLLNTCDVAVGARYMEGGGTKGWSLLRKVISGGGNLYAKWILNLPFNDLTGGFNGWRRPVLEKIQLDRVRSQGYSFQVELKYRAHKAGFQIKEFPIFFQNRTVGTSKMSGNIVFEAAFRVLSLRFELR